MSDTRPLIYSELSEKEAKYLSRAFIPPGIRLVKNILEAVSRTHPFCRENELWPHRKDEWSFLKVLSSLIETFTIMASYR